MKFKKVVVLGGIAILVVLQYASITVLGVSSTSVDAPEYDPVAHPPKPIDLREYRAKGFKSNCRLVATIHGCGQKSGWGLVRDLLLASSDIPFSYETELEWSSEVLENDGINIIEKRNFTTTQATWAVGVTNFGLTAKGVRVTQLSLAAVAGPLHVNPGVASVIVLGTRYLQADKLMNVPVIGDEVRSFLERRAKQDPEAVLLKMGTKFISTLTGREVILVWHNGKLQEAKFSDTGKPLDASDREIASKAAVMADLNLFPTEKHEIGKSWTIQSKNITDYLQFADDLSSSVSGKIMLRRQSDSEPGRIAHITTKEGGKGSPAGSVIFSGKKLNGNAFVNDMDACFVYGPSNKYLKSCKTSANVNYSRRFEKDHPFYGMTTTANPTLEVNYTSDEIH